MREVAAGALRSGSTYCSPGAKRPVTICAKSGVAKRSVQMIFFMMSSSEIGGERVADLAVVVVPVVMMVRFGGEPDDADRLRAVLRDHAVVLARQSRNPRQRRQSVVLGVREVVPQSVAGDVVDRLRQRRPSARPLEVVLVVVGHRRRRAVRRRVVLLADEVG